MQEGIGLFHAQTAEIRNEMYATRVACQLALGTFLSLFPTERKEVAAVTAPIGTHIRESVETMRHAVVEFDFVWIGICVGLADTLGNDFGVAVLVTGIFAVGTLHTRRDVEEVAAERAAHNVVECLRSELVTILLHDILLLLSNSTFTVETDIKWPAILDLLDEGQGQMDPSDLHQAGQGSQAI